MLHNPHRSHTEQVARQSADTHLRNEPAHRLAEAHTVAAEHSNQEGGQHVCHRVVTTALQLQQRAEVLFETLALGTQYGKD